MNNIIINQEKRKSQRININLPFCIEPDFIGEIQELSESGVRFTLDKPFFLSIANGKIGINQNTIIETEIKVVWRNFNEDENTYTYGAYFTRLKDDQLNIIKLMINSKNS